MSNALKIALSAAAVVVVAVVGFNLLPGGSGPGGAGASPSAATPSASAAPTTVPTAEAGLPQGPFVVTAADDPVQITVDIASSGWEVLPDFNVLSKDDDGLDPPETVGGALVAWVWPAGTGFHVYGDPCHWSTTIPETPATTPDDIAAALASQAVSDPTAPADVTVSGYAGKLVTLQVPMSYEVPGATREEEFGECDEDQYVYYGTGAGDAFDTAIERNAQGPGQIDELMILDVNGSIVILDVATSPATPADLLEELRTLARSATFE
jgi:hypothetical protein